MWLTGLKAPANKQTLMQNKTLKLGNMYITKESLLHIVELKFKYQNASEEVCHNFVKKKKAREKRKLFMEPPPVIKEDCF